MDHLKLQLGRIQEFISSWPSNNKGTYDDILQSRLSESFTDAGLCLKELWMYDYCIHREDNSNDDKARISLGGRECLRLLRRIVSGFFGCRHALNGSFRGYYDPKDLAKHLNQSETAFLHISGIVKRFLKGLNSTISVQANTECRMNLWEASRTFLSAAVRVERLLAKLKDSTELKNVEQGVATMKI